LADVHTAEQRRRNMQAVRSRDTKQELRLRGALWSAGLTGYRVNLRCVIGTPDVVYTRWRVAVFVDGCFWHACPQCYREPASNVPFWTAKIEGNRRRDALVNEKLAAEGWLVIRLWEHEVRDDVQACVGRVRNALHACGRCAGLA